MRFAFCFFLLINIFCFQSFSAPSTESEGQTSEDIEAFKYFEEPSAPKNKIGSSSFGHLATSNNAVLKKNKFSVGTLYVGYGITDNITLATSPFILSSFLMHNYTLRTAWEISKREDIGFELGYFRTFGKTSEVDKMSSENCEMGFQDFDECYSNHNHGYPKGFGTFQMEAWMTRFTYSRKITSSYRTNITAGYYYYIDDERPFSFRMDPQNKDVYSVTLTSLHEIRLKENWFWNLEGGMWGLNYHYPYFHTGTSIQYQKNNYLVGLGASSTFSPFFPKEKARKFTGYDSRLSVHPEIQIQGFF